MDSPLEPRDSHDFLDLSTPQELQDVGRVARQGMFTLYMSCALEAGMFELKPCARAKSEDLWRCFRITDSWSLELQGFGFWAGLLLGM